MIKNLLKEEYERAEQMRDYWGQVAEGTIARKIFAAKHGNKQELKDLEVFRGKHTRHDFDVGEKGLFPFAEYEKKSFNDVEQFIKASEPNKMYKLRVGSGRDSSMQSTKD